MTPPVFFNASSCSSSRLRLTLHSARAPEWEAMIGALDSAALCIIDCFDACEMSTMMPKRFISAMTCVAEGRNALPFPALALAGVGVAELVVAVVAEREVARAALVEFFHAGQIIAERIAVLDAHERGFFAIGVDAANVRRAQGYFDSLRRDLTRESVHGVELFDCGLVSALVSSRLERVRILTLPWSGRRK